MYIIRITATGQFVRMDANDKVRFVSHRNDATRFADQQAADRALRAVPYSLGARRLQVNK